MRIFKQFMIMSFFIIVTLSKANAAIVSQSCVDEYDPFTTYLISQTCNTATAYNLQGTVTLVDPLTGQATDTLSLSGNLTQDSFVTDDFSGSSSYGETSTHLELSIDFLGTYTMDRTDVNLDGALLIGTSIESLTGSGLTLGADPTDWLIDADGVFASVMSLDGDLDGINGINLLFEGSMFQIADVQVSAVPLPAAVWLFGSGLVGLVGLSRRKKY